MMHDTDLARLADAQAEIAGLEVQQRLNDRLAAFAVALVVLAILIPAAAAWVRSMF